MIQCIAELYKLDSSHAYQQAFLYIRQLALHLRLVVVKKEDEAFKQVISWQYLNCIQLWTRVICSMPNKDELEPLAFPLSQVIHGVFLASQSSVFIPLKFHLMNCLQQIAACTQLFIPTSAKIIDILENANVLAKPTPSTDASPKFQYLIKLPVTSINKPNIKDSIVNGVISLVRQDAEIYRYHVGLPEYLFNIIKKLRVFSRKCRNSRWKDLLRALISQLESFSNKVVESRGKLNKAPVEVTEFEPLLPVGVQPAAARYPKPDSLI